MRRNDDLSRVLAEFCAVHPEIPPLTIETAWKQTWLETDPPHCEPDDWRSDCGVYFFIDFCKEGDFNAKGENERFSVFRRIGKAVDTFAGRMKHYGHLASGVPGKRRAGWKCKKTGNWRSDWFYYGQIDFVRIEKSSGRHLERFILRQIHGQENRNDVPKEKRGKPFIYDDER